MRDWEGPGESRPGTGGIGTGTGGSKEKVVSQPSKLN